MLIVLSPAKTLDYETPVRYQGETLPAMSAEAERLAATLRRYSPPRLAALMSVSDKLARLNVQRFKEFSTEVSRANARPAMLAFAGDVYEGLQAATMGQDDLAWAQDRVRMLSGLYGLLRPLDLMQPYRLEMGTRLKTRRGTSLYEFWGRRIAVALRELAADMTDKTLVNLASDEYSRAIDRKALGLRVVQPVFEEPRSDPDRPYAVISFMAKKARGAMTRFAIDRRIEDARELREFDRDGYRFVPEASDDARWVFRRQAR
ncbi:MAG: peroxide stress protein YaaA [Burkholderiaceae bacterium]